jgi:hypothetical protein
VLQRVLELAGPLRLQHRDLLRKRLLPLELGAQLPLRLHRAAGRQPQLQLLGHHRSQIRQHGQLVAVDLPCLDVHDIDRAEAVAIRRDDRPARVEAKAEGCRQRILARHGVGQDIRDHVGALAQDRRRGKAGHPRCPRLPVQAVVPLEPDPLRVHETDGRNRCRQQSGGEGRNAVEPAIA